jgi:Putative threonine/serine exporter
VLRRIGNGWVRVQMIMPVVAAFVVASITFTLAEHGWGDADLRAMIAPLVTFLPGAALTMGVVKLSAARIVTGSTRLVSGALQPVLLAFGLGAAAQAFGLPTASSLAGRLGRADGPAAQRPCVPLIFWFTESMIPTPAWSFDTATVITKDSWPLTPIAWQSTSADPVSPSRQVSPLAASRIDNMRKMLSTDPAIVMALRPFFSTRCCMNMIPSPLPALDVRALTSARTGMPRYNVRAARGERRRPTDPRPAGPYTAPPCRSWSRRWRGPWSWRGSRSGPGAWASGRP